MKDVRIANTTYVFDDDDRKPLPRAARSLDEDLMPSLEGRYRVSAWSLHRGHLRPFSSRRPKGGVR